MRLQIRILRIHLFLFFLSICIFLPANFQSIGLISVVIITLFLNWDFSNFHSKLLPELSGFIFIFITIFTYFWTKDLNQYLFHVPFYVYIFLWGIIITFIDWSKFGLNIFNLFIRYWIYVTVCYTCLNLVLIIEGLIWKNYTFGDYTYNNFFRFLHFHPTYYSILALFCLILTNNKQLVTRFRLNIIIQLILIIGIFLAQSKINLVFLAIYLILLPFYYFSKRQSLFLFTLIIIGLILGGRYLLNERIWDSLRAYNLIKILVSFSTIEGIKNIEIPNGSDSIGIRIVNYCTILSSVKSLSFFGEGLGAFNSFISSNCKNFRYGYYCSILSQYNPHNQFIQFIVEQGFIGTMVYIISYLIITIEAIKKKHWLYIFIMIILNVNLLFECLYSRQLGVTIVVLVLFVIRNFFKQNINCKSCVV